MTDEQPIPPEAGGSEPSPEPAAEAGRAAQAREWLAQLEHMIEQIASHAGPVAREIGAKAAELAAVAGEKAGPLAKRAAEVTEGVGTKVAERSRTLAGGLRREAAAPAPPETPAEEPTPEPPDPSA